MSTKRNWDTANITKIGAVKSILNQANKIIYIRTFHCIIRFVWNSVKAIFARCSLTSREFRKNSRRWRPFLSCGCAWNIHACTGIFIRRFQKFSKTLGSTSTFHAPERWMNKGPYWEPTNNGRRDKIFDSPGDLVAGCVHQGCTKFHMLS
jgi:hypothetical protein